MKIFHQYNLMGTLESRTSLKFHMHQIDENIYLGDQYSAQDEKMLNKLGIKHIVQPYDVKTFENFAYCKNPLPRGKKFSILPVLQECLSFMHEAIQKGEKVLVHCKFGKNRSATIVIAYYMATKGWSYDEAKKFIRSKRAIVPTLILKDQIVSVKMELASYLGSV